MESQMTNQLSWSRMRSKCKKGVLLIPVHKSRLWPREPWRPRLITTENLRGAGCAKKHTTSGCTMFAVKRTLKSWSSQMVDVIFQGKLKVFYVLRFSIAPHCALRKSEACHGESFWTCLAMLQLLRTCVCVLTSGHPVSKFSLWFMGVWLFLLHRAGSRSSQDPKSQFPSCKRATILLLTRKAPTIATYNDHWEIVADIVDWWISRSAERETGNVLKSH